VKILLKLTNLNKTKMADKTWNNSVMLSFFQTDTRIWWALLHTEGRGDVTKLIGAFIKHYLPQNTKEANIFLHFPP